MDQHLKRQELMKNRFSIQYLVLHHFWIVHLLNAYTSENFLNLGTKKKFHLKYDFFDGSVVDGIQKPIIFSFISDKQNGLKVFCDLEKYT